MEWDTDAYETDGTEDNIDFSTSDDENEKHSGTSNIPSSSVGKSIKVLLFIFGINCDFDVPLTLSIQYLDTWLHLVYLSLILALLVITVIAIMFCISPILMNLLGKLNEKYVKTMKCNQVYN